MSKINILQPNVFNMISAGEVVERPSSVVKELVENSIDAGATSIDILVEQGGLLKIQVSDNGVGIEKDDMRNAFLPHATSKLKNITDLDSLATAFAVKHSQAFRRSVKSRSYRHIKAFRQKFACQAEKLL